MESGCFVCNAGYYCPRGAAHNPCPAGKFGNTTGQSNELLACPGQCPGGWFPNPNGAFGGHQFVYSACIPCPPGWRVKFPPQPGSMSISQACEQCPEGQFSSNYGSQSCTACPLGRFANTNTSSSDGGKGRLMLPSCTLECPAGKHGKSMGQTVEHLSCVPCEKGRYSASQGQGAVCAGLCPSGKYGNFTGTTSGTRHAQILAQRGSGAREVVSGMYVPRENMDPTQNKPTNTTRVYSAQPVTTVMAKL